jgi:hypothetical protein
MASTQGAIDQLSKVLSAENLPHEAKSAIEAAINEIRRSPLSFDVWIYRAVVVILGAAVLCTVFGGLALTFYSKGDPKMIIPDAIVAIGSAAVGALAGLLAPSPKGQ